MKTLSQIKDVDLKILSELDDTDLLSFCKLNVENKYVHKLCNDENFWRDRTLKKLGKLEKNDNRSWKQLYLKIVYYNDKFNKNADKILATLSAKGMKDLDLINYFLGIYLNEIGKYRLVFGFLYDAAKYLHIDLVKYYLDIARKYFAGDKYTDILGHVAAGASESGDINILRFIMSKGFDDWQYALYSAAEYGHIDIVKILLSLGARYDGHLQREILKSIEKGNISEEKGKEILHIVKSKK